METFTPFASLAGGMIIGFAASLLLWLNGRIAGISGIFGGLLKAQPGDTAWRFCFIAGLLVGGMLLMFFQPHALAIELNHSRLSLLVAGLMVGFGTRLGRGCTSGHGVCGLASLSVPSLIAVATFIGFGVLTAILVQEVFGGKI